MDGGKVVTHDAGAGIYESPYRPTPLSFEVDGKQYFNERPISTQQSAFTVVAQLRGNLPNAIGGILWFGNDDPNMIAYTPVYCCADRVPPCYDKIAANDVTFSWDNAFWVCNWVANMTYPRYSQLFPSVEAVRDRLEDGYIARQAEIEKQALTLYETSPAEARKFLTDYTVTTAQDMLKEWKKLGEYLIVKYNDQAVKKEKDGKFLLTPDGLAVPPERPGYPEQYRRTLIRETGDRYLVPEKK